MLEDGLNVSHIGYYHTQDSRGSAGGFPDYVIRTRPLMFAELKAEGGTLSAKQAEWLAGIAAGGDDAYLVVGEDGTMDLLHLAILRTTPRWLADWPSTDRTPGLTPRVLVLGKGRVKLPPDPPGGIVYRAGVVLQSR